MGSWFLFDLFDFYVGDLFVFGEYLNSSDSRIHRLYESLRHFPQSPPIPIDAAVIAPAYRTITMRTAVNVFLYFVANKRRFKHDDQAKARDCGATVLPLRPLP